MIDTITEIDFKILYALQKLHCGFLDVLLAFFSLIDEGGAVWIAVAVIMLFIKTKRKCGLNIGLALIMHLIINEQIIKKIVCRTRPFNIDTTIDTVISQPSSYSFPSGHTSSSFAAATVIFMYDKKLGIVAYIAAALIGFSRNYFFIHFPSDVVCGMLTGIIYGIVSYFIIKKISERHCNANAD